jgi:hypothetical protein
MRVLRILLANLMAGGAYALIGADASAAEPTVVVEVTSGRQFQGVLDGSSTVERLVLQTTANGITLRRPISWNRIVSASVDGRLATVAELQAAAKKGSGFGVQGSAVQGQAARVRQIELRDKGLAQGSAKEEIQEVVGPPPVATTMVMYPYIANWDGDVETDGLVVEVAPLDAYGALVSASGTLEVELFAAQRRVFHHAPLSGGDTLELVERWTRSLNASDYGPRGVIVRMPYGAIHPELRPDWMAGWYGLVHVKLSLPGHGVFEDSRDGVRVRPWAPNRDQLELNTGRRFSPTERLGRYD